MIIDFFKLVVAIPGFEDRQFTDETQVRIYILRTRVFHVTGKAPLHNVIVLITDINKFRFSHFSSQNKCFPFSLGFVEIRKSSNRVFYDIFQSSNRVFSTLQLTAGAGMDGKF